MKKRLNLGKPDVHGKIAVLGNAYRFRIVELTQKEEFSITDLSKKLGLSYTKCADYVQLLNAQKLITKRREGKLVFIRSIASISDNGVSF